MAAALVHDSQQPRIAVDGLSLTAATASVEAAAAAAAAAAAVTAVSNSNHQYMQQQYHQQKQQQQQQQQQTRPLEALASRFEALAAPSSAEARSRGVAESGAEDDAKDPPSAERAQKVRAEWSSASERTLRAAVSADPRSWRVGGSCGNLASECISADSGSGSGRGSSSSSDTTSDTSHSAVSSDGEDSAACEEVSRSLRVGEFAEACDGIGRLFSVLGPAFAFAGKEFSEKVADLHVAGRQFDTLAEMMAEDLRRGVARVKGSHTRNLLRVVRGLDLNRRIFALLLQDCSQPLRVYAGRAYNEVFGAVHPWPVRSLVAAGLFTLPSTPAFLLLLGESEDAWQRNAKQFVAALSPVIQAVDHLFLLQGLGLDW